jgi:hypothetical protein
MDKAQLVRVKELTEQIKFLEGLLGAVSTAIREIFNSRFSKLEKERDNIINGGNNGTIK